MSRLYHYKMCGLPDIYLANGFKKEKSPYGGDSVSIDNIKDLHQVIGLDIVTRGSQIATEEIRFLRKEMDMSQGLLADALGVTEITVRKWESATDKNTINKTAERLLKILYAEFATGEGKVQEFIKRATQLDHKIKRAKRITYRETRKGWQKQAA